MSDRLRVGIVGAAQMGEVHARAARRAGAVLSRVVSSTPERSAGAGERLGAQFRTRDIDELLSADDVDVVHICTPNRTHAEIASKALLHGKHVVCEKPLAVGLNASLHLESLAAAHPGLVTTVPFVYRFYASVRHAQELVREGRLGALRLLHGSYLQDWLSAPDSWNWRVDPDRGGPSRAFADIGVHWFDLLEFVTGLRVTRVVARTSIAMPERAGRHVSTEDSATILFETDGGPTGCVVVSQVSPGRKNRLWFSVDGSDASASWDQELPESLSLGSRGHNATLLRGVDDTPGAARYSSLPPGHPQGYQDAFDSYISDVYQAIAGENVPGLPTFSDGRRAAEITEAVLHSDATDSWVDVTAHAT